MVALGALVLWTSSAWAQPTGSIRGTVYDRDFDAPLALTQVSIVETGTTITSGEQGNYLLSDVPPGTYTLVFSKDGYARQIRPNVVVSAGQLTEIDASLSGAFTEMEEFVVEELQIGAGTEADLLQLRFEAPQLLDSIGSELMSRAGASDAAAALRLVAGATVSNGKFAVIRGLPDRYVVSQMNGVRLPSADADTRAVELDQFPAAVIESVQVSKTFTPDQQGDASGGAVNVILKGIPNETAISFKAQVGVNSQVQDRGDFLTYAGGGVNFWGDDRGGRDIPPAFDLNGDPIPQVFDGAVGTVPGPAPTDYKWSVAAGARKDLGDGVTIGGFANFFYERDSSFHDNGIDDSLWVTDANKSVPRTLVPETLQGTPPVPPVPATGGDFKTALFDITEASKEVQWGALGTAGIEMENHSLVLTYLYTRTAEDTATLATDTRGKEYFFPGYDVNDPRGPGNRAADRTAAPYITTETLTYNERTTETWQVRGTHTLPLFEEQDGLDRFITVLPPEVDWTVSQSAARRYQPDKRQFGSQWLARGFRQPTPPFDAGGFINAVHQPFKPAANFTLGYLQRTWEDITEDSEQVSANFKFPFEQWEGIQGYAKVGLFRDKVVRNFDQDTFANFNDNAEYEAEYRPNWTGIWPFQTHPISDGPPRTDVDYRGNQDIEAYYAMIDLPVNDRINVIAGVRWESTELRTVNSPEEDAQYYPPGATAGVSLTPGAADVNFSQDDALPAFGIVYRPNDALTLRASYSETIARQVFKEITPILQSEFLGGPIFIGNPSLRMSAVENIDLRGDYVPYEGGLFSVSYFDKELLDPIEYVQRVAGFTFTTPVNYPDGKIQGWEFEVRQDLGQVWEPLRGLSIGGNATFIDSEVTLTTREQIDFRLPNIQSPMQTRDATGAPDRLLNAYITYDIEATGTQASLFYTVKGDTLVAGATQDDGNFIPSIVASEFDTLNLVVSQRIGDFLKLTFQAKNLTNPRIETEYRSPYTVTAINTSYTAGIEYSLGLTANFQF